jgi:hypothetical protein
LISSVFKNSKKEKTPAFRCERCGLRGLWRVERCDYGKGILQRKGENVNKGCQKA